MTFRVTDLMIEGAGLKGPGKKPCGPCTQCTCSKPSCTQCTLTGASTCTDPSNDNCDPCTDAKSCQGKKAKNFSALQTAMRQQLQAMQAL